MKETKKFKRKVKYFYYFSQKFFKLIGNAYKINMIRYKINNLPYEQQ
jgi:hypothetical protein